MARQTAEHDMEMLAGGFAAIGKQRAASGLMLVLLVLCATFPSCVSGSAEVELDPDNPSLLARPYTADQIREAWKPGLEVLLRRSAMGQGDSIERMQVVTADISGPSIKITTALADGTPIGKPMVINPTWDDLRNHASYPAETCTRDYATLDTPLGRHECVVYHVTGDGVVTDYAFALDLPGPPIRVEERQGGEVVLTVVQVSRTLVSG